MDGNEEVRRGRLLCPCIVPVCHALVNIQLLMHFNVITDNTCITTGLLAVWSGAERQVHYGREIPTVLVSGGWVL